MIVDAFSQCHPFTNLFFFVGAIGFCAVVQHPIYLLFAAVGAGGYYLLLKGKKGWKLIVGMVPVFVILSGINPLLNTYGETQLFTVFGKPYTLEALLYGMVIAGMLVVMLLWFGCYSEVLTSDKFVCLFGRLIPSLSLLLVMILRMIPSLTRKAVQIADARKSIGGRCHSSEVPSGEPCRRREFRSIPHPYTSGSPCRRSGSTKRRFHTTAR